MDKVRLVSITPDAEKTLVYIARVSNPENQHNPEKYKLIKYLIKNRHWSPFEHAFATFEITTSRAIAQQILRHRSFSYQEFSQRYSEVAALEPIELRKQAIKNRQSSEDVVNPYITALDNTAIQPASEVIDRHLEDSLLLYRRLLDAGVAKETARFVLPLTTQTRLYMSGTLRSWIHYLALRNERHTQKEHQLIAQAIEDILRKELPVTFKALDELNETQRKHEALVATLAERGIFDSDTLLSALLEMPL